MPAHEGACLAAAHLRRKRSRPCPRPGCPEGPTGLTYTSSPRGFAPRMREANTGRASLEGRSVKRRMDRRPFGAIGTERDRTRSYLSTRNSAAHCATDGCISCCAHCVAGVWPGNRRAAARACSASFNARGRRYGRPPSNDRRGRTRHLGRVPDERSGDRKAIPLRRARALPSAVGTKPVMPEKTMRICCGLFSQIVGRAEGKLGIFGKRVRLTGHGSVSLSCCSL